MFSVFFMVGNISCGLKGDTKFSLFTDLPIEGWVATEPVTFDVSAFDSIPGNHTYLSIRHGNDYEYRNLWLFVDYISHDGKVLTDTINCEFADAEGHWYGGGFGSTYEYTCEIKPLIAKSQLNKIVVWQAMRQDTITDLINIGIRLDDKKDTLK